MKILKKDKSLPKFIFLAPKKSDILVYDILSERIISKLFTIKEIPSIKTRLEEINLFILFKIFLKFKFSFFEYVIEYIRYTEAKVVVTAIDNSPVFYRIKSRLPIVTIFFQNGQRTGHNDIFALLDKKKNFITEKIDKAYKIHKNKNFTAYKKLFYVDLMCVFNEMTATFYKKIVTGKTLIAGSILSNEEKIFTKKKNSLLYISLFRAGRKIHKNENILIKYVNLYCIKNNLNLIVLGKHKKGTEFFEREKKYYKDVIYSKHLMIPNYKNRKTYKLVDESKIVVSPGSTLGIESVGRKNKTVIINPFPNVYPYKKKFFGYFTKRKDLGVFWYTGTNKKKIFKILKTVENYNKRKWLEKIKRFEDETTYYDFKNKKLKRRLIKFLKPKNINIRKYLN